MRAQEGWKLLRRHQLQRKLAIMPDKPGGSGIHWIARGGASPLSPVVTSARVTSGSLSKSADLAS
jgi:hypothetical protein